MKKILSAVMAAAIVASMGVSAFAADYTSVGEIKDSGFVKGNVVPGFGIDTTDTKPDKTIYFLLNGVQIETNELGAVGKIELQSNDVWTLNNSDLFKFKYKKEEGAKYIKSIKFLEVTNSDIYGTSRGSRTPVIEVKLNDDYTDNDYKLAFTATFTSKKDGTKIGGQIFNAGEKIVLFSGNFWMGNALDNADQDYEAGTGGVILKPTTNDDNEITWEDVNRTLARLTFTADSDVIKFYPKLSTKWDNSDYAEYFADQNAFIFSFVANPTISSTSRALLELYNPYYDEEDDVLTVDPSEVIIYEVKDGELVDVTANFNATTNEDGDDVFTIKTRTLGTYIFAEKEAGVEIIPDDVPVDPTKIIPNTGL